MTTQTQGDLPTQKQDKQRNSTRGKEAFSQRPKPHTKDSSLVGHLVDWDTKNKCILVRQKIQLSGRTFTSDQPLSIPVDGMDQLTVRALVQGLRIGLQYALTEKVELGGLDQLVKPQKILPSSEEKSPSKVTDQKAGEQETESLPSDAESPKQEG